MDSSIRIKGIKPRVYYCLTQYGENGRKRMNDLLDSVLDLGVGRSLKKAYIVEMD